MSEEEMSKEEKLEAARKMFAEVKKGKKKGKKSKKNNSKQTPEPETEPEIIATKDASINEKSHVEFADNSEGLKNELEVDDVNLETEQNNEKEDVVNETRNEEKKIADEGKETDDQIEKINHQIEKTDNQREETDNQREETDNQREETEYLNQEEEIKEPVHEPITELGIKETTALCEPTTTKNVEESPVIQGIPTDIRCQEEPLESFLSNEKVTEESTFLTETLQSTITALTSENEKLSAEVSTLKSDNLDLKLTKMDLEMELENVKNELETQKEQIKHLTQQLAISKTDTTHTTKSNDDGNISVLSGTDYLNHTTSSFQNLTNFNIANGSQGYMDVTDVKERLQQWKGWNMDMRGWRSVGMGPVVDV